MVRLEGVRRNPGRLLDKVLGKAFRLHRTSDLSARLVTALDETFCETFCPPLCPALCSALGTTFGATFDAAVLFVVPEGCFVFKLIHKLCFIVFLVGRIIIEVVLLIIA